MAKVLNTTIHVHAGEETFIYLAGATVPKKHAKLITAEDVWEDDETVADASDDSTDVDGSDNLSGADDGQAGGGSPDGSAQESLTEPPRGGAGSGESEWREYASNIGLDTTSAENRDAIIALVEAHKAAASAENQE